MPNRSGMNHATPARTTRSPTRDRRSTIPMTAPVMARPMPTATAENQASPWKCRCCHSTTIPSVATAPTFRSGRQDLDHRRQSVATQLPLRDEPANGSAFELRTIGRRIATRDEDHDRPWVELGELSGELEAVYEGQLDIKENDGRLQEPDFLDRARGVRETANHVEASFAAHGLSRVNALR